MKKPSPIIKLAATGIAVVLILQFSEVNTMVSDHVSNLEVYGQISETSASPAQPTPEFDKILAKFSAKSSTLAPKSNRQPTDINMDDLFKKSDASQVSVSDGKTPVDQELVLYEAAVRSNSLSELSSRITLQAVTPTGAVIGGTFFEKNQKVTTAKYMGVKGEVVPTLKSLTLTHVVLEYPDKTSLKLYLSSPF